MEENQEDTRSKSSPFAWIGFAVMTAATAVLGYLYNGQTQLAEQKEITITEKVRQLAFTQTKLDSVSAVLDARIAEVTQLGGKVDDLLKVKVRLEADNWPHLLLDRYEYRLLHVVHQPIEPSLLHFDRILEDDLLEHAFFFVG